MTQYENIIAKTLLEINAVSLNPSNPYTWASGLKSPIYCDNRLTISHPTARNLIEKSLADLIINNFKDVDVIAGTATAGIPHAAIIAHLLNKPMIYVRSSHKDHGKKNAIEGALQPGQKVVMVEDLISTGKSVIQAAKMVEENGGEIIGVVAIFNYLLEIGKTAFDNSGYTLLTLTHYLALLDEALQDSDLKPFEDTLKDWYKDPKQWSENFIASQQA